MRRALERLAEPISNVSASNSWPFLISTDSITCKAATLDLLMPLAVREYGAGAGCFRTACSTCRSATLSRLHPGVNAPRDRARVFRVRRSRTILSRPCVRSTPLSSKNRARGFRTQCEPMQATCSPESSHHAGRRIGTGNAYGSLEVDQIRQLQDENTRLKKPNHRHGGHLASSAQKSSRVS
jgi:hypothetical protein